MVSYTIKSVITDLQSLINKYNELSSLCDTYHSYVNINDMIDALETMLCRERRIHDAMFELPMKNNLIHITFNVILV